MPFLIGLGAATLLFTGAGAYSVDARLFGCCRLSQDRGRAVVLAVAAAVVTWMVLNGTNPIHFTAPPG